MRRAKALLLLTLILSQCLFLSGCLSPVQLNRQAIVQGIGIDYQNGKYRLTFQGLFPFRLLRRIEHRYFRRQCKADFF